MQDEWQAATGRHQHECASLCTVAESYHKDRDDFVRRQADLEATVISLRSQLQLAHDETRTSQSRVDPNAMQHLRALSELRQSQADRDEQFITQISAVGAAVQALQATIGNNNVTTPQWAMALVSQTTMLSLIHI